jgi:plastocyanin
MKTGQQITAIVVILILAAGCSPAPVTPASIDGISNLTVQPAGGSENGSLQVQNNPVLISIQGFAFSPDSITVKVGTLVTWTNLDQVGHTATALNQSFDSGLLNNGESFTFQFDQAGTFEYLCTPHPSMRGSITVIP